MKTAAATIKQPIFENALAVLFRPSFVVAILYVLLIGFVLITRNYSVFDFIHVGTIWSEHIKSGTWGYDGQFYYQIARNPFQAYHYMDNAAYRYQHILYGLVAGILSFGQAALIPYTLLFINVLSVVVSTEIIARLLEKHGFSPWFSLAIGLYFGQAAAITFDTAEPFTYLLVCVGIWLLDTKQSNTKYLTTAALFMGLATLSRETAVLFPAAFAIFFLVRRQWGAFCQFVALGILPLLLWLLCLRLIFGRTGLTFTPPFEHIPFVGLFVFVRAPHKFWLLLLLLFFPTLSGWILVGRELLRQRFDEWLLIFVLNLVLITFLSRLSYHDLVSCGRIATGLVLAMLLYGIRARDKRVLWAAQFYSLTFLVFFVGIALHVSSFLI